MGWVRFWVLVDFYWGFFLMSRFRLVLKTLKVPSGPKKDPTMKDILKDTAVKTGSKVGGDVGKEIWKQLW